MPATCAKINDSVLFYFFLKLLIRIGVNKVSVRDLSLDDGGKFYKFYKINLMKRIVFKNLSRSIESKKSHGDIIWAG